MGAVETVLRLDDRQAEREGVLMDGANSQVTVVILAVPWGGVPTPVK